MPVEQSLEFTRFAHHTLIEGHKITRYISNYLIFDMDEEISISSFCYLTSELFHEKHSGIIQLAVANAFRTILPTPKLLVPGLCSYVLVCTLAVECSPIPIISSVCMHRSVKRFGYDVYVVQFCPGESARLRQISNSMVVHQRGRCKPIQD